MKLCRDVGDLSFNEQERRELQREEAAELSARSITRPLSAPPLVKSGRRPTKWILARLLRFLM